MQQEFGPQRVFNGPIAEDYILGTADGFSRLSDDIRVVVEGAEFADYFWPAAEQMVEMSHEFWRTAASSSRTSPSASPPAATSAAASTTPRTSRAG